MEKPIRVHMVASLYGSLCKGLDTPEDIKDVLTELLALFISHYGGEDPSELLRLVYSDVDEMVGILSTTKQVSEELDAITERVHKKLRDNE
jgi:hypothetical protein